MTTLSVESLRENEFFGLKSHPHYRAYFKKIGPEGERFVAEFVVRHQSESKPEFVNSLHRAMTNLGEARPKNWTAVSELIEVINGRR